MHAYSMHSYFYNTHVTKLDTTAVSTIIIQYVHQPVVSVVQSSSARGLTFTCATLSSAFNRPFCSSSVFFKPLNNKETTLGSLMLDCAWIVNVYMGRIYHHLFIYHIILYLISIYLFIYLSIYDLHSLTSPG
jgi:hypothetical protein